MEQWEIAPILPGAEPLATVLGCCNSLTARYGLVLDEEQMEMLIQRQAQALRDTGRVEFGRGPYEKLIYAFCDSPYVTQTGYADLLAELCALFYRFKGESGERWSDDELIEAMARLYNGSCSGSAELMADRLWQALHDGGGEEDKEEEDAFDQ